MRDGGNAGPGCVKVNEFLLVEYKRGGRKFVRSVSESRVEVLVAGVSHDRSRGWIQTFEMQTVGVNLLFFSFLLGTGIYCIYMSDRVWK